jgi:hypothetical protein
MPQTAKDHVLSYLEEEGLSIEPQWYPGIVRSCPRFHSFHGTGIRWRPEVLPHPSDGLGQRRRGNRGRLEHQHPQLQSPRYHQARTGQELFGCLFSCFFCVPCFCFWEIANVFSFLRVCSIPPVCASRKSAPLMFGVPHHQRY